MVAPEEPQVGTRPPQDCPRAHLQHKSDIFDALMSYFGTSKPRIFQTKDFPNLQVNAVGLENPWLADKQGSFEIRTQIL